MTGENNNSFQANINSSDDPCALDRLENILSKTYSLNINDGNMPFLSHDPNWVTSQEERNEDVCKERKISTCNKENEVQNIFILQEHGNKDDLINNESESMSTISDDTRDKDFEIYEYTEPESEKSSSLNSDDSMIPPANKTNVTPLNKVLPAQSVIEKIQEQVRYKFTKYAICLHQIFHVDKFLL